MIDALDVGACLSCQTGGGAGFDVECDCDIDICDCRVVICEFGGAAGCCPACDGDLNNDGIIDTSDVLACLDCQVGVFPSPWGACACDVNRDRVIDLCDCMASVYGGSDALCDLANGDISPPALGGDGVVDIDDILCVLEGFNFGLPSCSTADVAPCLAPNGIVDIYDNLTVLGAFTGAGCCS